MDIVGFSVDGSHHMSGVRWWTGIGTLGSHGRVTGNNVHHIANSAADCTKYGGSGINANNIKGGYRVDITQNVVDNIGPNRECPFIHGIYMATTGTVKNNVTSRVSGWGIHLWHDARSVDIVNNTVVKCYRGGIVVGGGENYRLTGGADYVHVSNNIVYGNGLGIAERGKYGTHNTYTNNLSVSAASADGYSLGNKHSAEVKGNPLFMDYVGGDYRLRADSPAVDAGSYTRAPLVDSNGTPRPPGDAIDLGAYERPRD